MREQYGDGLRVRQGEGVAGGGDEFGAGGGACEIVGAVALRLLCAEVAADQGFFSGGGCCGARFSGAGSAGKGAWGSC